MTLRCFQILPDSTFSCIRTTCNYFQVKRTLSHLHVVSFLSVFTFYSFHFPFSLTLCLTFFLTFSPTLCLTFSLTFCSSRALFSPTSSSSNIFVSHFFDLVKVEGKCIRQKWKEAWREYCERESCFGTTSEKKDGEKERRRERKEEREKEE